MNLVGAFSRCVGSIYGVWRRGNAPHFYLCSANRAFLANFQSQQLLKRTLGLQVWSWKLWPNCGWSVLRMRIFRVGHLIIHAMWRQRWRFVFRIALGARQQQQHMRKNMTKKTTRKTDFPKTHLLPLKQVQSLAESRNVTKTLLERQLHNVLFSNVCWPRSGVEVHENTTAAHMRITGRSVEHPV